MPDPYPLDRPTPRCSTLTSAGAGAQSPQAAALVQDERRRVRPPRGGQLDGPGRALLGRLPNVALVSADVRAAPLRGCGDGGSLDDLAPNGGRPARHALVRMVAVAEHGADVRTLVGAA